jgi:hypothetical protein
MPIRAVIVDLGGVLLNIPEISRRYTKWETRFQLQAGELHLVLRHASFFSDADSGKFSEYVVGISSFSHKKCPQAPQHLD